MKKQLLISSLLLCSFVALNGCSTPSTSENTQAKDIKAYNRDSASGTRSALVELTKIGTFNGNVIEVSSNGEMMTKIGNDEYGIGYISLSTLTEAKEKGAKPLTYSSIQASKENVLNETYSLKRPFAFTTRAKNDFLDEKENLVKGFVEFLTNSFEGLSAIQAGDGIVSSPSDKDVWEELIKLPENIEIKNACSSSVKKKIKLVGSTSVEKPLTKAADQFKSLCNGFDYEKDLQGSGDGFLRTLGSDKDGAKYGDIGFASRDFKTSENTSTSLKTGVFAQDAVVMIVGKKVPITNITQEAIKNIYEGTFTKWDQL